MLLHRRKADAVCIGGSTFLKNALAKVHPDLIWNDGAFEDGLSKMNKNKKKKKKKKKKNKRSTDMKSVHDLKIVQFLAALLGEMKVKLLVAVWNNWLTRLETTLWLFCWIYEMWWAQNATIRSLIGSPEIVRYNVKHTRRHTGEILRSGSFKWFPHFKVSVIVIPPINAKCSTTGHGKLKRSHPQIHATMMDNRKSI